MVKGARLFSAGRVPSEEMGMMHLGTPLTNRVQSITLQDEDVVLVLSGGLEEGLTPQQRLNEILRLNPPDPKALCKALVNLKAATRNDRTLVVISGPYEHSTAKDAWKELETSVKSLAAQVSGLAENDQRRETYITLLQKDLNKETQIEQRISQRIEAFKAESQEKLKKLEAELAVRLTMQGPGVAEGHSATADSGSRTGEGDSVPDNRSDTLPPLKASLSLLVLMSP